MAVIQRAAGGATGRSSGSAYGDLVWAVATCPDKSVKDVEGQTRATLAAIDRHLAALGSGKDRLINATVYVTDIARKAEMDKAWNEWIGPDPANWPQRACIGVALAPGDLVEIVVIAARHSG